MSKSWANPGNHPNLSIPQVSGTFKIKGRTTLAVLDFTSIMDQPIKDKFAFRPVDRFPGAAFDVTVVMPKMAYASGPVDAVRKLKHGRDSIGGRP